jgi:hypothetical protein
MHKCLLATTDPECSAAINKVSAWVSSTYAKPKPKSNWQFYGDTSSWWNASWFNSINMKSAYTIFQPTQNIPTLNLQGSYSLAFQTSESRHSFRFNYRDLQRIANKPEYFELESNHYYLLDTPLPTEESRRIDQATFDLASQLFEFFTRHPASTNNLSNTLPTVTISDLHDEEEIQSPHILCPQENSQTTRFRSKRKTFFGPEAIYDSYIPSKGTRKSRKNRPKSPVEDQSQEGPLFPAGIIPSPLKTETQKHISEEFISPQVSTHHPSELQQWEDPDIDNLQPYWTAIQNFDLDMLGKYGVRTFKKLFQYGDQLCSIYNKITHNILINCPSNNPSQDCGAISTASFCSKLNPCRA